jgi:hypothetical protein
MTEEPDSAEPREHPSLQKLLELRRELLDTKAELESQIEMSRMLLRVVCELRKQPVAKLTSKGGGDVVLNLDRVCWMCPCADGTKVHFGESAGYILVRESIEEICALAKVGGA